MRHKKGENKDRHSNRDEIKMGKNVYLFCFLISSFETQIIKSVYTFII